MRSEDIRTIHECPDCHRRWMWDFGAQVFFNEDEKYVATILTECFTCRRKRLGIPL